MIMLIDFPLVIPREIDTLFVPAHPQTVHLLHSSISLELLVCRLSGNCLRLEELQQKLQVLSYNSGGKEQKSSTEFEHIFKDGNDSAILGMSIPFQHL